MIATATPTPVYLLIHVKHGAQNIQDDCHQWLSDSFRVHQTRFRTGLHRSPDSLAVLRGPTSKGERKGLDRGRGEEGKGRTSSLSKMPGFAPVEY